LLPKLREALPAFLAGVALLLGAVWFLRRRRAQARSA